MNCREFKAGLIELARGGGGPEARRHAEVCPACALFLELQRNLTEVERVIAVEAAAPAYLEARLLNEYTGRRLRPHRRAFARRGAWIAAGALAASLGFLAWHAPKPAPKTLVAAKVSLSATTPVVIPSAATVRPQAIHRPAPHKHPKESEQPFVEIPYTQPLAPWERAEVVRMEMPVAALIAAGFPVDTTDPAAEARADVIIGEDGRARAVRLISISERSIER